MVARNCDSPLREAYDLLCSESVNELHVQPSMVIKRSYVIKSTGMLQKSRFLWIATYHFFHIFNNLISIHYIEEGIKQMDPFRKLVLGVVHVLHTLFQK